MNLFNVYLKNRFWSYLARRWSSSFWLVIREPVTGQNSGHHRVNIVPFTSLGMYIGDDWRNFESAVINDKLVKFGWEVYNPKKGDVVELLPSVGAKSFSSAYIAKLNAVSGGGAFIKTFILTENPVGPVTRYYADWDRAFTFNSQTYNPLPMRWDGLGVSSSMALPTMRVTTYNLGGEVTDYLEDIDILENDCIIQLLHQDLLGDVTAKDSYLLQVQAIEGDELFVTFTLGLNLGFNDLLPRGIITKAEFPGIVDDVIRR